MPGELAIPAGTLFRIGRAPDPLGLPPWNLIGTGRFDNPRNPPAYRVLYAGERRACFYERLADFCVDLDGVASQGLTLEWLTTRRIAEFRIVDPDGKLRWLDLTSPETFFQFRSLFKTELTWIGLSDFDISAATNEDRSLSQAIGQWTRTQGYQGFRYVTRRAPSLSCWAVFEGIAWDVINSGSPITSGDADLQNVAHDWNLALP